MNLLLGQASRPHCLPNASRLLGLALAGYWGFQVEHEPPSPRYKSKAHAANNSFTVMLPPTRTVRTVPLSRELDQFAPFLVAHKASDFFLKQQQLLSKFRLAILIQARLSMPGQGWATCRFLLQSGLESS